MPYRFDRARAEALFALLAPRRLTRVVDIGASPLSEPPYHGLKMAGLCEVWGFEPQRAKFDELMASRRPNEHYVCAAVGDGGKARLSITSASGFTSLLTPSDETFALLGRGRGLVEIKAQEDLDTSRLDDLADVPQPDLLKIDIQGSELAVMQNGREKLARASVVITEVAFVPLYRDQPLIGDQMRELDAQGFMFHRQLHLASWVLGNTSLWDLRGGRTQNQALDGDAAFLRRAYLLPGDHIEEVKHMAILADGVLGSLDVVGRCLDLLIAAGEIEARDVDTYLKHLPRAAPKAEA